MKTEKTHWADQIALEVEKRVQEHELLREIVKKQGYLVYDEKTPSGKIHIGSGRGWIIHDVIAKAMRDIGLKAKFVLSSDDIDPFDKMNQELPKGYEQYLGMPFRDIPSPVKGYKSFADYYFMQCVEKFEEFGIEAETESTGELYDKGVFNNTIKTALDNADKINAVYERIHGNPPPGGKLPFNPICEKCGRIGTTFAYEWDKEREVIKYRCMPDFVAWAKGCGHEGEISPYNGHGKFPWKVEWAAKWPSKGVVCELAGKDHFTKGGSRDVACGISVDVFKYPPPYPSEGYNAGKGYEFFTIGGKKMSTSKGFGMGFVDATTYAPAQILRYLLVRSRPHAVIDFDPMGTNDLILLYERYDQSQRVYYGKEEPKNEEEGEKQKRIYELSHVGKITKKMPLQVSFIHAAIIAQIALDEKKEIELLKKTGHIPEKLSKADLVRVKDRLNFTRKWVKEFAPEQYKFLVNKDLPEGLELDEKQRKALKLLAKKLKEKQWTENDIYEEFYRICKEIGLEHQDFFKAAYNVLISRDRGPKLASFVLTLGDKAAELFEKL